MLKKDTNLLIAIGQRNPISVGIDYKEAWVIIGNAAGSVPHHKGDALEKKRADYHIHRHNRNPDITLLGMRRKARVNATVRIEI